MTYHKHPRTYHLPWSDAVSGDDKILQGVDQFHGKDVIVTEKRDGENTSLYPDGIVHARSVDGVGHPWQYQLKAEWSCLQYSLPEGWRVVGENLTARHSIAYENLFDRFEVFAIADETNTFLNWDSTVEWCGLLGLTHVPVLWDGVWDEGQIRKIVSELNFDKQEGIVVRLRNDPIHYNDWVSSTGKFVRKDHVKTDQNWRKNWEYNTFVTLDRRMGDYHV